MPSAPLCPQALKGTRRLSNLRYRAAVLSVELTGFGNQIASITLDGQPLPDAIVPATLTGAHTVRIELLNEAPSAAGQHLVPPPRSARHARRYLHRRPPALGRR